jgi:hypothetical protein
MAYVRTEYCDVCKRETNFYNSLGCGICLAKQVKQQERMWEAQDPETKITNLRHRIEALERSPARF